MNNGNPLNSNNAKHPAIAVLPGTGSVSFVIAYQVDHDGYKIILEYFSTGNSYQTSIYSASIYNDSNSDYSFDSYVSLGYSENLNVIAVFRIPDTGSGSSLYYWYGTTYGGISGYKSATVDNTNSNSCFPTIVSDKYFTPGDVFHLVWEQSGAIKYQKLTGNKSNNVAFTDYYEVSAALGYSNNSNPTIADYVDDKFIVGWVAENQNGLQVASVRPNYGTYWGTTTFIYDRRPYDIETISSNTAGGCIIAFGTNNLDGQYVKTSNLNYKYPQDYTGNVKVCNGPGYSDALLSTLETSSTPYKFMHYGQSGLPKEGNNTNAISREVNLASGENRLFVNLGNIEVDGESIGFYNVDSLGSKAVSNENKLSNYLVSEGFDLTDKTEIYFDFGIEQLNDNSFSFGEDNGLEVKVVLMDDKTNEILAEVKRSTVKNKINSDARKTRIKLNTKQSEKRRVKLAMVIDGVEEKEMNLVTVVGDGANLPKEGVEEITIETVSPVTDYKLSQNYPNPFNPSTTIKYELPAEGLVTIKVYDVLGKEITTLVNEKKNSGRYEVTFNGDGLASGMYIYKIDVKSTDIKYKDYSSVQKMLLIK